MRKITEKELRIVQSVLDLIRPIVDLDMVYLEEENMLLLGDNYIIRGLTHSHSNVEVNKFILVYGSDHPGDDHFSLDRWEEEDIATSTMVDPLLPLFVSNLMSRIVEEIIYKNVRYDSPMITGKC
jgi:hypothetical protein